MTLTSSVQQPDARLLMLGAGVFYINEQDEAGASTYFRHMGNISSGDLSVALTELTIKESMTRARNVYLQLQKDQVYTLNLALDEWAVKNVGLFIRGASSTSAAQAATPVSGEVLTTVAVLGATYFTAKYGPIASVTVHNTTTPAVLVLGTDYTINLETGAVTILASTVAVVAGDDISIDYTPTAYSAGLVTVHAGSRANVRGAIRFIGDPQHGPRLLVDFWKASIAASANMGLISAPDATTVSSMTLTATIESDLTNHASSPIFDMTYIS